MLKRVALVVSLGWSMLACSDAGDPWVVRPPGGPGTGNNTPGVDAAPRDAGPGDGGFGGRIFGEACLTTDLRADADAAPGCAHPSAAEPLTATARCAGCGSTMTGTIGTFALDVPAVPVDVRLDGRSDLVPVIVRAVGEQMLPSPVPSVSERDRVFAALSWNPDAGGAILVHVIDDLGARVANATFTAPVADVAFDAETDPPWSGGAATGAQGAALFGGLTAGLTTVTVRTPGGATATAEVRVEADALSFVILRVR